MSTKTTTTTQPEYPQKPIKKNESEPFKLRRMGGLHAVESPIFARFIFTFAHCCIPFAIWELIKLGMYDSYYKLMCVVFCGWIYDVFGGLGITAGAHRFWAHKTFECNYIFESILMIFNCIAFQGEIIFWCRDHRVHHKYSDTKADPHNATRGFWFSHIGWLYLERDNECMRALAEIPIKDLLKNKIVMFQWKYYIYLVAFWRFILPTLMGFYLCGSWKVGFFFNANMMWCQSLHHTFLVNSAAHLKWCGYRPYEPNVLPNENKLVIVAAMGEGHHNFHHKFPQDYATSELDFTKTFNPTKAFIDLGAKLGMVTQRTRVQFDKKKNNWKILKVKGNEKVE